ncbi:hypothetical protein [Streptomyces sp. MJM8645]|uniref:hypothetical protein n=1 Tax=Streptomycetaceae TaxID=2062 RepID=UPI0007AF8068|nr:hypothetical protein [Streptomyces sp. MJM8645]
MLLRLLAVAVLIAPAPLTDQPMRVAIHIGPTGTMTVARVLPEPACATASDALTIALLNQGFESYGVNAPTPAKAAAIVHHLYATDQAPDPDDYPPAANC